MKTSSFQRGFSFIKRQLYRHTGYQKVCVICDSHVGKFLPYRNGKRAPLMVALDCVGSDVNNFECPRCGCHDRERHLFLYLKKLELFNKFTDASILHFAPEHNLSRLIEDKKPIKYIRGDLYPKTSDIEKIDILSILYPDEYFDFVIANHVLEHVSDDLAALSEIRRVLKVGGYAFLQTPFSPTLSKTFSDSGIDTDFARYHAYGQEDHVRLYGNDIVERFESVGFKSHMVSHNDAIVEIEPTRHGVNVNEPFFLFERMP